MRSAPRVSVVLSRVLAEMTGGQRHFQAEGETLGAAMKNLCENVPELGVHFFDETGQVRRYIICIQGDAYVRADDIPTHRTEDGVEVRIINALAGG